MTERNLSVLFILLFLSGCSITSKPTEITSEKTLETTTNGTSKITSSTGSDETSAKNEDTAAEEFAQSNLGQLRANMAVGEGEHLAALASLLNISEAQKQPFYLLAKDNFDQIFISPKTSAKEVVSNSRKIIKLI